MVQKSKSTKDMASVDVIAAKSPIRREVHQICCAESKCRMRSRNWLLQIAQSTGFSEIPGAEMGGAMVTARGLAPPAPEGGGVPRDVGSWFCRSRRDATLESGEVGCACDSCGSGILRNVFG